MQWILSGYPAISDLDMLGISTVLIAGYVVDILWITTTYPAISVVDIHHTNSWIWCGFYLDIHNIYTY